MLGRSVRTSQPQGPARIDWSNPITRGLIDAFDFTGVPRSVILQTPVTFFATRPTLGTATQVGRTIDTTANGFGCYFQRSDGAYATADQTHIAVANFSGGGTTFGGYFLTSDATAANQVIGLGYVSPNDSYFSDGASTSFSTPGIGNSDFKVKALSVGNGSVRFYNNGVLGGTLSRTATARTTSRIRFFGDHASFWVKGRSALHLIFNRALSEAEIKSLSDNPWQIFASDSKSLWTPAETISGAGSSITAASGSSTTSTATGQAQAASTQTATTGTSTTSTITGAAVVSATITAANGTSTTGTLAAGGSSAATITPAGGTSTVSTMVGSSTSGANVADGPPIGGFVAIGQLGPASPVASGSTIAPASGSSIAETLTSSTSAAATITSAAGTSVTSTMVGASTSGTAATMTAAGGTSTTSTMTSAAISSAVMLVNNSSSITSTMVGFPPTENNADTHDGYFHKLWAKLAKKPEYQLEILEERLEEIAEEIQQVKAITRPVIYQSAPIPQNNPFDAQAKLLQALIMESARIRRDIEDEEEAEMLLML